MAQKVTCGSSLQTGSVRSDESGISTLTRLSYTHLKRTAGNVTAVELHVDDVDPVLTRDEANGVFVWRKRRKLSREPQALSNQV